MFWYILFISFFLIIGLCYFMGLVMIHIMNKKLKRPIVLESNQIEPFSDTIYKKKRKRRKKRKKKSSPYKTVPENQEPLIPDTSNLSYPQPESTPQPESPPQPESTPQPESPPQDDNISLNEHSVDDSQDHNININKFNNVRFNLKIPLDKIIQSRVKQIMKEKKVNVNYSHLDVDGTLKKYRNYYRNLGKYDKEKSDKKMLEQLKLTGYNINDY